MPVKRLQIFEKVGITEEGPFYLEVSELKKGKRFKSMADCVCKLAYLLFCNFISFMTLSWGNRKNIIQN